ncbi:hypothetical protein HPP92_012115 [Vanilla planifolia]|uniref:Uncharacterized protein n=1 Tax=Vanilla planifolia TaxID=51239 RepID=A0A835R8E0_VANPL|nr:hypothetical protein HPP92_012115 [Vanilla planifolia]
MNGGRKPLSDHSRLGVIASDVAGDGRNRSRDAEEVAIGQQALRSARMRRPDTIMAGEVAARVEDASGGGSMLGRSRRRRGESRFGVRGARTI